MKFFATSLILTCALCLVADARPGLDGIGADPGDDTLKSIKTTILTKDGVLGDIFGGRIGRTARRRGRLLDQLGGGGEGGPLGGLFGGEGNLAGVLIGLAQDIVGAIKTAKLELVGNLLGNVGGGGGLGLGLLGGGARSGDGGPLAGLLGGAGGGGLGEIVSTVSDLKKGLFQKESGAFSGLLGGGDGGNPIGEAKSLLTEGLGDFGGLLGSDSSRSGRRIHNIALPFASSNHHEGLMQHSMCNFFCRTSRHRSVQETCLKRNNCLRVNSDLDDLLEVDDRQGDDDDAVITEIIDA